MTILGEIHRLPPKHGAQVERYLTPATCVVCSQPGPTRESVRVTITSSEVKLASPNKPLFRRRVRPRRERQRRDSP